MQREYILNLLVTKGNLQIINFVKLKKECDIDFYKLIGQDIRYTIRYKKASDKNG